MNKAKLVNSVLTGGGIGSPQHLNVVIGNEDKGFPRGHVLDANATLALVGTGGAGTPGGGGTPGTGGGTGTNPGAQNTQSNLEKVIKLDERVDVIGGRPNDMKDVVIESTFAKTASNLVLQNSYIESDILTNRTIGSGSIIAGLLNSVNGYSNITAGSGSVLIGGSLGNFSSSFHFDIDVVPNTENDKLRLKVKSNGLVEYGLKEKLYPIYDYFAIKVVDGKDKIVKVWDSPALYRDSYDFTRINDEVIEMNNPNLRRLKDYDKVIVAPASLNCNSSVVVGSGVECNSNYSLVVGRMLKTNVTSNGSGPMGVACFGAGNSVSNPGELACGRFNVSQRDVKDDDNFKYSTLFSIGGGDTKNHFNIIECALRSKKELMTNIKTEDVYIKGIGGYDGTNAASTQSKSLQQVVEDMSNKGDEFKYTDNISLDCFRGDVSNNGGTLNININGKGLYYYYNNVDSNDVLDIFPTLGAKFFELDSSGNVTSEKEYQNGDRLTSSGVLYIYNNDGSHLTPSYTNSIKIIKQTRLNTIANNVKESDVYGGKFSNIRPNKQIYDEVVKGVAFNIVSNYEKADVKDYTIEVFKLGWNYVAINAFKTKDNEWIVTHQSSFIAGTISKPWSDVTINDVMYNGVIEPRVMKLSDFCALCRTFGGKPYFMVQQTGVENNINQYGDLYHGKPGTNKLIDIINQNGLRGKCSIISPSPTVLAEIGKYDKSIKLGYFSILGSFLNNGGFNGSLRSIMNQIKNAAGVSENNIFLILSAAAFQFTQNAINEFQLTGYGLELFGFDDNTPLEKIHPYVSGVICDYVHAGEKKFNKRILNWNV